MDPILESPGARQHAVERMTTVGRLGGGEQLPSTTNESATIPSATGGAAVSSRVEIVVTSTVPESGAENRVVPKE